MRMRWYVTQEENLGIAPALLWEKVHFKENRAFSTDCSICKQLQTLNVKGIALSQEHWADSCCSANDIVSVYGKIAH